MTPPSRSFLMPSIMAWRCACAIRGQPGVCRCAAACVRAPHEQPPGQVLGTQSRRARCRKAPQGSDPLPAHGAAGALIFRTNSTSAAFRVTIWTWTWTVGSRSFDRHHQKDTRHPMIESLHKPILQPGQLLQRVESCGHRRSCSCSCVNSIQLL